MNGPQRHLKTLKETEQTCVPGLVEILRTERIEGVRYVLFDITGWHRDYDLCLCRSRATQEQRRVDWEVWVRMEKIATVLDEAHRLQVGEAMEARGAGELLQESHGPTSLATVFRSPGPSFPIPYTIRASKGVRTWINGP